MSEFLSPFPNKSSPHMACLLKGPFYFHPFNPEYSQLFIQDAVEAKNEQSNSKNLIPFTTTELFDVCRV